ncbi:MAG: hypothetical protein AAF755_01245 [Pseudomonadota bacterium]
MAEKKTSQTDKTVDAPEEPRQEDPSKLDEVSAPLSEATEPSVSQETAEQNETDPAGNVEEIADALEKKEDVAVDIVTQAGSQEMPLSEHEQDDRPAQRTIQETISENEKTAPPMAAEPSVQKRSVFWPVVTVIVAGAVGFGTAEFNMQSMRGDVASLRDQVDAQRSDINALQEAPPASAVGLEALRADLATFDGAVADLNARIVELETRALESGSSGGVDSAAYERVLSDLRGAVEAQQSEIEMLLANARSIEEATAESARIAGAQAALTQIASALSDGRPFEAQIEVLVDNGFENLPNALLDVAVNGVATLSTLQANFAENARAVLSAARAVGAQDQGQTVGSFLRRQLGARSVTPREGSEPDAVLSRAEAAMREGQVAKALAELDLLPENVQDPMAAWLGDARAHAAAQTALKDLSERLAAE